MTEQAFSCNVRPMDTRVGHYIVRRVSNDGWALILPSTGERLRTYADYVRATEDAKRYTHMTEALSK